MTSSDEPTDPLGGLALPRERQGEEPGEERGEGQEIVAVPDRVLAAGRSMM